MRVISGQHSSRATAAGVSVYTGDTADEPFPVSMPSTEAQAAHDIADVSVEGRPADASAGPGMLLIEMAVLGVVVVAGSLALGWWLGWGYGGAVFVLGCLALLLNPVMGATAFRVRDRKDAADQERAESSGSRRQ